ncbi:MAG TPA: periplasmic heavy metal sensor [Bryobacteraceae bacterium]|nr:periplasmic heavy metal sensor [Bryobacteraceae bacterium]
MGKSAAALVLVLPGILSAQGPGPGPRPPWWESPIVKNLDLSDAQTKQIQTTVSDYRDKLRDLRAAVNRAETDFQAVLNEDPVDQRKANEAIEQLMSARAELFKTTSQMDLKLRMVLTGQQWQELQSETRGRILRPGGRRGRGPNGPPPLSGAAAAKR